MTDLNSIAAKLDEYVIYLNKWQEGRKSIIFANFFISGSKQLFQDFKRLKFTAVNVRKLESTDNRLDETQFHLTVWLTGAITNKPGRNKM
jgi:hypothetical protein